MADRPTQTSERAGRFLEAEAGPDGFSAFHPNPLPPAPPLVIDERRQRLLDRANQELGRLDGVTLLLPDPDLFLYSYIRKEAVLSSQIEGTQSSLSDLLLFENDEAPGVPLGDVRETSNYIRAMTHGVESIRQGRLPLSNRLLKEVHALLLERGRGGEQPRGEFPPHAELARRHPSGQRTLRAAAVAGGRAGDERSREVPP
jgi:Fic family protein